MTGAARGDRHGLGDPRIPWTILLRVGERDAVPANRLRMLARRLPDPVTLYRSGDALAIAADHSRLDGLSLLAVLEEQLGVPVRSTAAGVGTDRPQDRLWTALSRRAIEISLHPPAVVAASTSPAGSGDVFVEERVPGHVSTGRLVGAGARAVARWNRAHHARDQRVSVAIGVSTRPAGETQIGDHSAYLRLTDAETMRADEVRAAIATAPLQPGGTPVGGGLLAAVTRLLAPRLGSSLLVSHLGDVETTGCTDLAFYPVTGGASGVALGAVGIGGHTTITLRARAAQHDEDGLRTLLATVLAEL